MHLRKRASGIAEWAFLAGVITLSLQWFPSIPLGGAQLSDLMFLVAAVAMVISLRQSIRLPGLDLAWIGAFVAGVIASGLVNDGSYLKLVGHLELVAIMIIAASLSQQEGAATRLRRALIWAAIVAAAAGLLGALLFFAGESTRLLAPYGQLLPGSYPRIRGTAIGTNMLATILATGMILLRSEARSSLLGKLRFPIAFGLCAALLFTFSRTWLTLGAGVLIIAALEQRKRSLVVIAVAAVFIVITLLLVSARFIIVLEPTRFWEVAITAEPGSRWVIWRAVLDTIAANPIFGAGPGAPAISSGWSAHLVWLNLWAVLGLLPLCAFAFGIWRTLRYFVLAPYVAIAVVVILLDGMARDVEDMRHLWVLMGMLLGSGVRYSVEQLPVFPIDTLRVR